MAEEKGQSAENENESDSDSDSYNSGAEDDEDSMGDINDDEDSEDDVELAELLKKPVVKKESTFQVLTTEQIAQHMDYKIQEVKVAKSLCLLCQLL